MSDYDRNVAARGFGAARATAIDAGLRAYMIRIYNYMAAGVALTGVVIKTAPDPGRSSLRFRDLFMGRAGGSVGLVRWGRRLRSG